MPKFENLTTLDPSVSDFFVDCCSISVGYTTRCVDLYKRYCQFCAKYQIVSCKYKSFRHFLLQIDEQIEITKMQNTYIARNVRFGSESNLLN